jgi:hypothetical protein
MVMLWDQELIDHRTARWTVDRLCDRAERQFGGYDVVVLWNNYPLSGLDPRDQLAYFDDLPGGRAGLRDAVRRFHDRGVRVLIPHKPWVPGVPAGYASIEEALVELVVECELDGFFLDCGDGPTDAFRELLSRRGGPDRIFCSEAPARLEPTGHEVGSWMQMTDDTEAPGVYRNRWLDPSHLVYESRRYYHDPIRELQRAWFNGGGHVIWENVFGYWSSYSPRYQSWLRVVLPAQRHFADVFVQGEFLPHVGGALHGRCYVGRWNLDERTLWTIVNRRDHALQKRVVCVEGSAARQYVDVISGQRWRVVDESDGRVTLEGRIERHGVAGVLAVDVVDDTLAGFLERQRERFAEANWHVTPWPDEHRRTDRAHVLVRCPSTPRRTEVPSGMIRVPDFDGWLVTRYRMRECGYIAGAVDECHVYDAFEKECRYSRWVVVRNVALDERPVTNADFARFLDATGYRPDDDRRFLQHWRGLRSPPAELADHPVTYISRDDARAYARWAGKRLPTEEEWQVAAQGGDAKRTWPWGGSELDPTRCNHATGGTTPVTAFPNGRSTDGFWDLCGNVWEMVESERSDGHTRYDILKGGCWYHVARSHWLFDTGARPADWGAKRILLCPAWERCETVGFRCAVDLET